MSYSIGIRAKYLLPMTEMGLTLEDAFIGIENDKIAKVTKFLNRYKTQCKKFLNLSDHIILPGLINTHTHLAMTQFRGIEDNLNLQKWLFEKIFPLEEKFVSKSFVKLGTQLAAFECIRFGTTTIADMYFYPEESLKVWDQMGLRGLFGQPVISFPSPESKDGNNSPLFLKFETLFKKYKNHTRLQVALAPHAPYTCNPQLLNQVKEAQEKWDCYVHTHLAETSTEVQEIQSRFGRSPTEHLNAYGLLGPKTLCAHVVHTSKKDQELLKQTQTNVIHNPDSNFKLGSGIAPITEYIQQGITVCLGTDGSASNNDLCLFGAMDLMAKGQKVNAKDISSFSTWMAIWSATRSGARALGFENSLGQIKEGFQADLIAVDTRFAHMHPISDPASHLVFSTQGLEVDTTIVEGKILLQNKKFTHKGFNSVLKAVQKQRFQVVKFLDSKR